MSDQQLEFTADMPGERLDKFIVARVDNLSRAQIQTLIENGLVTIEGQPTKPGLKLRGGERISITIPPQETETIEAENIPLTIVYEDDDLAVIDKPAGMVVHPGTGNETGTLVNAILGRYPQIQTMDDSEGRSGIVHRLDKDTSGLIVIAKNARTLKKLMAQFKGRDVDKTYIALLERTPPTETGRIEAPIGRDPNQRKRMAVQRDGKPASTEFEIIERDFREGQALVRLKLLTGRTHQIRVHMAFIGCPVVGDRIYGFRKQRIGLKRQFLHAAELAFDHPRTRERMTFQSPLPVGLLDILSKLRTS
jgi:23S rRNA pseudouridine1911/1915/1917 synthase